MSKIEYADLIGVQYKANGRSKEEGFDCFGLVREIYRRAGYDIEEYTYIADDLAHVSNLIHGEIEDKWAEVDYRNGENIPVPALIGIRFNCPAHFVNHTAVYIGDGLFIHCRERIGVCVDRINSPAWRRQITGIYIWAGGKKVD